MNNNYLKADINKVSSIVAIIYEQIKQLEELFEERKFTMDGHLVGSIGEVLAAYHYDLELYPLSEPIHDAYTLNNTNKNIQIKTTQIDRIGLGIKPDYLIVLKLCKDTPGIPLEVYNGSGEKAWELCGNKQKSGQRYISLKKLSEIKVAMEDQIPVKHEIEKYVRT